MTDPLTYRARIKAKGLDSTGVTEDHAKAMANTLGGKTLMIIEVENDAVTRHADGATQVHLAILNCEPVPAAQEDVVRELQRALYRQRPEIQGQETLKGTVDVGPSVQDATDAAKLQLVGDGGYDAAVGDARRALGDEEWDGNTETS